MAIVGGGGCALDCGVGVGSVKSVTVVKIDSSTEVTREAMFVCVASRSLGVVVVAVDLAVICAGDVVVITASAAAVFVAAAATAAAAVVPAAVALAVVLRVVVVVSTLLDTLGWNR